MGRLVNIPFFSIKKSTLLNLISKIRSENKTNTNSGHLVVRFAYLNSQTGFENFGVFLTGYIVDKQGNSRYLPYENMIQAFPQIKEQLNEKLFENFINLTSNYQGSNNIEKGGIAHLVFTNEKKLIEDNIENWLINTAFENEFVYLYPAFDYENKYTTIIFTNDSALLSNAIFQFVNLTLGSKSYFDRGGTCCPPERVK